ncbi:KOW domain-containing RNA-binding protein [Paludifilum halophilum]|uniref:RNA-binding protein n=1 Tax=Paludifilum halophilum TaxID=1642702 RepID=A0A235B4G7_9BACL|nr:KOW domain-containing RNA-binding protein [Paludifilum halophilum]OYD06515.1 RNA-binding protein [Paludifilum halophilum]
MDVTGAEERLNPGQIVRILRGREAGKYAIVIGVEKPNFVWLADGAKRPIDRSKRKNVKHIQPTKTIAREVADSLKTDGRVNNAELRYALNQYLLRSGEKKGE